MSRRVDYSMREVAAARRAAAAKACPFGCETFADVDSRCAGCITGLEQSDLDIPAIDARGALAMLADGDGMVPLAHIAAADHCAWFALADAGAIWWDVDSLCFVHPMATRIGRGAFTL